jgi:DNA-binding GntR family transcriptional regulator
MHTDILSVAKEVVGPKTSSRLGFASGQEWLVVRGIARLHGKQLPVCWSDYYIHRDYASVGRLVPRHSGPISLLLEDFFALSIVEIEQEIATGTLTRAHAASLKAKAGATSIEVRRTYKIADEKIIQYSIHTHPAPRFRYVMNLRRVRV